MGNDGGIPEQVAVALSKSELRFSTLVGAVSAITWSCPSSGLHVEPQPEWMAFTGQSAEEMLGDGWTKAVHPEDRETALLRWREAVVGAAPYEAEVRIRRHDGEWRWMSVRAVPIRDANGEVAEWFGMNIDITEQKNAAEALRKSEERFRLFADNSPTIAWMKDEDGRFVYFSRTYERSFGVEAADWLGKTDADLWPPGAAEEFRRNDQLVLSADHPIEIVEETLQTGRVPLFLARHQISFLRRRRQAICGRDRTGHHRTAGGWRRRSGRASGASAPCSTISPPMWFW